MPESATNRIAELPCWNSSVEIEPLSGGITNLNFKVTDGDQSYAVRLGEDDPIHLISRRNEIASCEAAFDIGVSPELVYHEQGILVVRFIDGKVFGEADVRNPDNLERIVDVLKRFHRDMPTRFNQVPVMFWVFQVFRHYHNLLDQGSSAHAARLPGLAQIGRELEAAVGPVDIVFGHNDLLPANLIDDGSKIWLIDFDYAGFNSPLFDLSNLASNNSFDEDLELVMLESYFGARPDEAALASYHAMKCASLLRETLWSMVSELHSRVDMDFADYTRTNLERFEEAHSSFQRRFT